MSSAGYQWAPAADELATKSACRQHASFGFRQEQGCDGGADENGCDKSPYRVPLCD
jgi:hypothetical protein